MMQFTPLTMKIKVIDDSERKYSFQQINIISSQFIVKNTNSICFYLKCDIFVYLFLCWWVLVYLNWFLYDNE